MKKFSLVLLLALAAFLCVVSFGSSLQVASMAALLVILASFALNIVSFFIMAILVIPAFLFSARKWVH